MRVLAKFVGFVISKPFAYENPQKSSIVTERQVALRNHLLPTFDVKSLLIQAITDHRLTIVIPWVSQYLSMLDYVTLRLNYYQEVFNILYEIYMLSSGNWLEDPSKFIVRVCLGWLFEHPHVPKTYYNYRLNRKSALASDQSIVKTCDAKQKEALVPIFETIVVASCPFLSDFRVAIKPVAIKQLSRTGQYRHIRTKLAIEAKTEKVVKNNQEILLDVFLKSQSPSVVKIVDLVIDRVFSAVIKDFQFEHLVPMKKAVQQEVKGIKVFDEVILNFCIL